MAGPLSPGPTGSHPGAATTCALASAGHPPRPQGLRAAVGPPRKNRAGDGLYPVHVGPTLRLVRDMPGVDLERVEPRYWPWARAVTAVPGVREVVTWNCVLRLRKALDSRFEAVWASVADVEGWCPSTRLAGSGTGLRRSPAGGASWRSVRYRGRSAIVLATPRRRRRGGRHRPSRRQRPRSRRRSQGRGREARPTTRPSSPTSSGPASPTACATCGSFSRRRAGEVDDPIDLLYIDGAHRLRARPATTCAVGRQGCGRRHPADPRRVQLGRRHAGLLTPLFFGDRFRYVGRGRRWPSYRRERLTGERLARATPPARPRSCRGSPATC